MKIKLEYSNTNYTIDADGTSFTLARHGFNTDKKSANFGNPTETVLGYFSTMPSAINKVIKDGLGSLQEEITLKQYVTMIENANKLIEEQLRVVA